MEIWKNIKGYETMYQVSNLGRVKSLARIRVCSNGNKLPIKERILQGHTDTKGYIQVELKTAQSRNIKCVHRLVAEAFIENPENKEQVNHIDGNKKNNCVDNLEWCTCTENIRHAWANGLHNAFHGEEHPNSKLTNEQVIWIKENYKKGDREFGASAISRRLGVSISPIYNIIHGKGWKHI